MIILNQIFDAPFLVFIAKLALAMMLGIVLGIERIHAHKTAGMRTYALVAVAAAAFVATSLAIGDMFPQFAAAFNPAFVVGNIIVGIGFLGAGLIIFKDGHIENLTTSAGMWVSAGIGILSGLAMFREAIFLTIITFFVLGILSPIERAVRLRYFPDPEFAKENDIKEKPAAAPRAPRKRVRKIAVETIE